MAGRVSGKVAGITIEIGGDTQKLNKALSSVNKDINSTQRALKDVNRLLKLDPKNTTLLGQKQKLLAEQIGKTKDKLSALKDAEEQAREAFEKGEIGEKEFDALQREIIDTENKLKNLEKEAEKMPGAFQKVAEAGEKVKDVGGKVEGIGKKLLPVTAGVAAIGTASVAAFKELDEGFDIVEKKTGATGDALEKLKGNVNDVFQTLPVSAAEAGTAIGEVNTRFGMTGDILSKTSEEFLKFAKINDTDLNSAIDNVDSVMNKFGIDSSEVGNVLGLLTKAGQDTGISMETLLSSLMQNSAVFKDMNLSLPESVNLLAQFEANGVQSSIAIAGLKKAQQEATKGGRSLSDVLNETVTSISNATTETEAMQIATSVFGKKGAAEMTQAIREGRLSVDDLNSALGDYGDVVQNTFSETQDPLDSATIAFNNMKVAGAELGATLMTELAPYIDSLVSHLQDMVNWFTGLDDSTKKLIITIALIAAAVGPLLVVVGKVLIFVGQFMTYLPALKTAITAVTGVVGGLSSGFLIAAGIIAAVIAVGVLLYKNWDTIKAKAKELVESAKTKFAEFKTSVSEKFQAVQDKAKSAMDSMKEKVKSAVENIKNTFSSVKDKMTKPFTDASTKIREVVEKIKDKINELKHKFESIKSLKWLRVPKLSVDGGQVPFGIGGKGRMPHIGISWNKKAVNTPYILDSATIFGMKGDTLIGGGETKTEVLYGKQNLLQDIEAASGGRYMGQLLVAVNNILSLTSRYLPDIAENDDGSGMDPRDFARWIRSVI